MGIRYETGFKRWCDRLYDVLIHRVVYDGLPTNIPHQYPQRYLVKDGQCGLVKNNNEFVFVLGNPSGVTYYTDEFVNYVYSNPCILTQPIETVLGVDCVLLRNNETMQSDKELVEYYANLLAHTDLTYEFALVNHRMPSLVYTEDSSTARAVKTAFASVWGGSFETIANAKVMGKVSTNSFYVPPHGAITELLTARVNILRQFYLDIGLISSKEKSQAVLSDETFSDYQVPSAHLSDVMYQRQKDIEEVNRVFGVNWSVRLADPYQLTLSMVQQMIEELISQPDPLESKEVDDNADDVPKDDELQKDDAE